jgi:hypothetical protein
MHKITTLLTNFRSQINRIQLTSLHKSNKPHNTHTLGTSSAMRVKLVAPSRGFLQSMALITLSGYKKYWINGVIKISRLLKLLD